MGGQVSTFPADTLRNNAVVITSKRRHVDVITSKMTFWRNNDVIITSCVQGVAIAIVLYFTQLLNFPEETFLGKDEIGPYVFA